MTLTKIRQIAADSFYGEGEEVFHYLNTLGSDLSGYHVDETGDFEPIQGTDEFIKTVRIEDKYNNIDPILLKMTLAFEENSDKIITASFAGHQLKIK